MAKKTLKTRIIQKHDTEANWLLATNFTPMNGEIIIYDEDDNYNYKRVKIGDGTTNVNALPFQVTPEDIPTEWSDLGEVLAETTITEITYDGTPTDKNVEINMYGISMYFSKIADYFIPRENLLGGTVKFSVGTITTEEEIITEDNCVYGVEDDTGEENQSCILLDPICWFIDDNAVGKSINGGFIFPEKGLYALNDNNSNTFGEVNEIKLTLSTPYTTTAIVINKIPEKYITYKNPSWSQVENKPFAMGQYYKYFNIDESITIAGEQVSWYYEISQTLWYLLLNYQKLIEDNNTILKIENCNIEIKEEDSGKIIFTIVNFENTQKYKEIQEGPWGSPYYTLTSDLYVNKYKPAAYVRIGVGDEVMPDDNDTIGSVNASGSFKTFQQQEINEMYIPNIFAKTSDINTSLESTLEEAKTYTDEQINAAKIVATITMKFVPGTGFVTTCDTSFANMWAANEEGKTVLIKYNNYLTHANMITEDSGEKQIFVVIPDAYGNTNYFTIKEDESVIFDSANFIASNELKQTTGTDTASSISVMSQKAVTDALALKSDTNHTHTIEDIENLQTTLDKLSESDIFTVQFTIEINENGENQLVSDKTYDEIVNASNEGKVIQGITSDGTGRLSLTTISSSYVEFEVIKNSTSFRYRITKDNEITSSINVLAISSNDALKTDSKNIYAAINEIHDELDSHTHTIEDVENLQTTLDEISEKASESDLFIVNVTNNGDGTYSADKTIDEITLAYENGKIIKALYEGVVLDYITRFSNTVLFNKDVHNNGGKALLFYEVSITPNGTNLTITSGNTIQFTKDDTLTTTNKTIVKAINELDSEIATLTTESETKTDATSKLNEAKQYADNAATAVKNDLLNGAGEAYDTLKELGELINENTDAIDALETVATNKQDKTDNNLITTDKTLVNAINETYELANGAVNVASESLNQAKAYVDEKVVQSDWDINDKTNLAYIANKPFGEYYDEPILENQSITFQYANMAVGVFSFEGKVLFDTSYQYRIIADGEEVAIAYPTTKTFIEFPLENGDMGRIEYIEEDNETWVDLYDTTHSNLSIYKISETKLDEKYIPDTIARVSDIPEVANADWNVNDETNPAYVKNRPFYSEQKTIMPKTTFTLEDQDGQYGAYITDRYELEFGKNYKVICNDVEYICTANILNNDTVTGLYLGNALLTGGSEEDTGEPFLIMILDETVATQMGVGGAIIYNTTSPMDITVSIIGENIKYIDPKFIKDMYYETDPVETELCNGTFTFNHMQDNIYMCLMVEGGVPELLEGKKIKVNWDNTEYSFILQNLDVQEGALWAGNGSLMNSGMGTSYEDTGEPFTFLYDPNGIIGAYTISTETTHDVTVIYCDSNIIKIDEKYLPDYVTNPVGQSTTGNIYDITGTDVTAGEGAEIFNDYENNKASGYMSHAEGWNTIASGDNAHAENEVTFAYGRGSHAEGTYTTASGQFSHAEGSQTTASGHYSHAEGDRTKASGISSHAEGSQTTVLGASSHAEGLSDNKLPSTITILSTNNEIITAWNTTKFTLAKGQASHVEGENTLALGNQSHAEGLNTTASGSFSHTEGYYTTASAEGSHAEGNSTIASGYLSHAEGGGSEAIGTHSHAEGCEAKARGGYSHAEGYNTIASGENSHVQGTCNIEDVENRYAHIVGNGTADNARSNAHTLDWDGNAEFQGDVIAYGCDSGETPVSLVETYEIVKNITIATDEDVMDFLAETNMVSPLATSDGSIFTNNDGEVYSI